MSGKTGGPALPKTGGPAFPCMQDSINQNILSLGMTLRDYFAGQALGASWMAKALTDTRPSDPSMSLGERIAEIAYAVADKMLTERAATKVAA